MKITRDNYEPFFLDYLEGRLEETMIDEFLDFLETNPDLKEELHLFEHIELPGDPIVFTGKEHLYKSVAEENVAFEIKTVALMEGDLKGLDRQLFEQYLTNDPELQKEYDLMAQTRLVADTGIKYPHKRNLYKKSVPLIWLNWVVKAAAVVLIFWGIQSLFQTGSQPGVNTSSPEFASVKTPPVADEEKVEAPEKIVETKPVEKLAPKGEIKPQTSPPPMNAKPLTIAEAATHVVEKDLSTLQEINPLVAQLEPDPIENQLAVWAPVPAEKSDDSPKIMTLDEFMVNRAKKAGGEGLLSAKRVIRFGLNVASELSGDRIGYKEKEGKIASLDFETRLMAFSIPLQKE